MEDVSACLFLPATVVTLESDNRGAIRHDEVVVVQPLDQSSFRLSVGGEVEFGLTHSISTCFYLVGQHHLDLSIGVELEGKFDFTFR